MKTRGMLPTALKHREEDSDDPVMSSVFLKAALDSFACVTEGLTYSEYHRPLYSND
jgi:hypothetical protein